MQELIAVQPKQQLGREASLPPLADISLKLPCPACMRFCDRYFHFTLLPSKRVP